MTLRKFTIGIHILRNLKSNVRFRSSSAIIEADKSTIDQDEISKLSKLNNVWWDVNGSMSALHSMNLLRVPFIRDCLLYAQTGKLASEKKSQPLQGFKIIDVGCGGGILSEPLARIGAEVTGLDASKELIDVAKEHMAKDMELNGKIEYVCGSLEEHVKANGEQYDAVVASEVLEHIAQKELFIEACSNIIKPGGSIIITTLNKTMVAWVTGVIAAEYILNVVPQETHDWEKFITPQQVQFMLEKYGCYTKLIHGMFYNFICNEWIWTPNTSVNYALHAVKKK